MQLSENQKLFFYWIREREQVRLVKGVGFEAPWSSDPIFQNTYFTNINREQDKVTKWIRNNWRYEDNKGNFVTAMIVARVFNLPSTLESFKYEEAITPCQFISNIEKGVKELQSKNLTVYNGAYVITTNGSKIDKLSYYVNIFNECLNKFYCKKFKTCEEAYQSLTSVKGLGSFLAAQVVADLKNSEGYSLNLAEDFRTFSAYGKGSLRGLSWFWGDKITPTKYQQSITEAYEIAKRELPEHILDVLCMQNLQNCFCEYDKYMRILNGAGRSKRKYNGAG